MGAQLPNARIFVGESTGRIKALYTRSNSYEEIKVSGSKYGPGMACQALVCKRMPWDEPRCVMAVARKNSTIDLIAAPRVGGDDDKTGTLLCTIKETRMRVGVERWVGLAWTETGLFSCTSGGFFRYVPLLSYQSMDELAAASTEELEERACTWSVASPLHHVAFYPPSSTSPTHFVYGGEQVLLSVWDISSTLAHYTGQTTLANTEEKGEETVQTGKKRASSSKGGKQRELLPGEVWRAKNLPNDHLSLARPPLIHAIGFLPPSTEEPASWDTMHVVVGTKDGILRTYQPSKKPRHTHEWQVLPKNQGSVRVLHVSECEKAIFVGDTARHLSMVDASTGRVLFQYKDITGTLTDVLTIQPQGAASPLVVGASLDHLIRIFDTGEAYGKGQRRRGTMLQQCFTGVEHGMVLAQDPQRSVDDAPSDVEAEDDEVWDHMATIGKDTSTQDTSGNDEEDDDVDDVDDDDDDDDEGEDTRTQRAGKRHRRNP